MKHIKLFEDFTDTHFHTGKEFIIKIYNPEEEVVKKETVHAENKDAAIKMAEELCATIEGYDEEAGWDYMII
jgi:hypothetical protein